MATNRPMFHFTLINYIKFKGQSLPSLVTELHYNSTSLAIDKTNKNVHCTINPSSVNTIFFALNSSVDGHEECLRYHRLNWLGNHRKECPDTPRKISWSRSDSDDTEMQQVHFRAAKTDSAALGPTSSNDFLMKSTRFPK